MYRGRIVEEAPARTFFASPQHPYTRLLFSALPKAVPSAAATNTTKREDSLPSAAPSAAGCAFYARCPHARASCLDGEPPLRNIAPDHAVACFRAPFAAPFAATL
jgi:oligopeptide/dipeptide ABC transporter ATP-binding protein